MTDVEGLDHIAIAVRSIEDRREHWERTLGARFEGVEVVPGQKVKVGVFRVGVPGHEVRLELLEPTSPDSTVARFIEKRGEGLHHLAFAVGDLQRRLDALKASGVRLIDESPRTGARGMRIAFLHPAGTGGVLTELCQPGE